MKKMKLVVVFAGLSLVQGAFAGEVDFQKVNPVMQVLLDSVVAGDDLVDYAMPRFDEKFSNFKSEKLKYDLKGGVKNTPWLDGGKAEVGASVSFVADRSVNHLGIALALDSTVNTDVLALFRYSALIALRKIVDDPEFGARKIGLLRRLSVVTSLEEVSTLLQAGKRLLNDGLQSEIDRQYQFIKDLKAGKYNEDGNEQWVQSEVKWRKTILLI